MIDAGVQGQQSGEWRHLDLPEALIQSSLAGWLSLACRRLFSTALGGNAATAAQVADVRGLRRAPHLRRRRSPIGCRPGRPRRRTFRQGHSPTRGGSAARAGPTRPPPPPLACVAAPAMPSCLGPPAIGPRPPHTVTSPAQPLSAGRFLLRRAAAKAAPAAPAAAAVAAARAAPSGC